MTDRKRFDALRPKRERILRRIGLLGGSFNPAHQGHRHISLTALKTMALDEVWWLVSPGNPLKDHRELAPLAERVLRARNLANHPRIRVNTFEAERKLTFTADTIAALLAAYPAVGFVWLMGADSLTNFHHWERWHTIARSVPIAVFNRPGHAAPALHSPFASTYRDYRIDTADARLLPLLQPPAWMFFHGRALDLSSTELRKRRNDGR